MKRLVQVVALAVVLFDCSVVQAGVNPDAPAVRWSLASSRDRIDYARVAATLCQSRNCGPIQLRACMDEVVRPPVPSAVGSMTIGEIAIGCIKILKAQD